jgi:hypothetical protein
VNEKRLKALRYLSGGLFLVVLGVCVFFVKWSDLDPGRTLGLVAILAFFETWRVQFAWGRPLRLGMAATLCLIAIRPMPEVVFIFLLGSLLGRAFSRAIRSGEGDFLHIVQRTYIVALAGIVYQLVANLGWDMGWNAYPPNFVATPTTEGIFFTYFNPVVLHRALVFPAAFLAMALIFYLGEMLTSSMETTLQLGGNWRVVLPQHLRQTFPIYREPSWRFISRAYPGSISRSFSCPCCWYGWNQTATRNWTRGISRPCEWWEMPLTWRGVCPATRAA